MLRRWQSALVLGFGTKRPTPRIQRQCMSVHTCLSRLPACLAALPNYAVLDQERHRRAVPLARLFRRAQPWKARPTEAGPSHYSGRIMITRRRHLQLCTAPASTAPTTCHVIGQQARELVLR